VTTEPQQEAINLAPRSFRPIRLIFVGLYIGAYALFLFWSPKRAGLYFEMGTICIALGILYIPVHELWAAGVGSASVKDKKASRELRPVAFVFVFPALLVSLGNILPDKSVLEGQVCGFREFSYTRSDCFRTAIPEFSYTPEVADAGVVVR
jgi:hypothetical protein